MSIDTRPSRMMATDWDGWMNSLPPEDREEMRNALVSVSDPTAQKRLMTNLAYISDNTGIPVETLGEDIPGAIRGYASAMNWTGLGEEHDEGAFYAKVQKESIRDNHQGELIGGADGEDYASQVKRRDSLIARSREMGMDPKSTFLSTEKIGPGSLYDEEYSKMSSGFIRWQNTVRKHPGYRPEMANTYFRIWQEGFTSGGKDYSVAARAAKEILPVLQKLQHEEGVTAWDAAPAIRNLSDLQMNLMQREIGRLMEDPKSRSKYDVTPRPTTDESGIMDKTAEYLGWPSDTEVVESVRRGGFNIGAQLWEGINVNKYDQPFKEGQAVSKEKLDQGAEAFVEGFNDFSTGDGSIKALTGIKPLDQVIGEVFGGIESDIGGLERRLTGGFKGPIVKLTKEQAAELEEVRLRKLTDAKNLGKLRELAQGKVLPLDKSGLKSAILGVGESIPAMATAMIPYVGAPLMAAAYTADARRKLDEDGIVPKDKINAMAPAIGVLQALADKLQASFLVKNPGLAGWMNKWGTKIAIGEKNLPPGFVPSVGRFTGTVLAETGSEVFQDFGAEAITKDTFNLFFSDVPQSRKDLFFPTIANAAVEYLPTMLLMSGFGEGVAHYSDIKQLDDLVRDEEAMRLFGISEENIKRVSEAASGQAAEEFLTVWNDHFPKGVKGRVYKEGQLKGPNDLRMFRPYIVGTDGKKYYKDEGTAVARGMYKEGLKKARGILKEAWKTRERTAEGDYAHRGIAASYEWAKVSIEEKKNIAEGVYPPRQLKDGRWVVDDVTAQREPGIFATEDEAKKESFATKDEAHEASVNTFQNNLLIPSIEEEVSELDEDKPADLTELDAEEPPPNLLDEAEEEIKTTAERAGVKDVIRTNEGWRVRMKEIDPTTNQPKYFDTGDSSPEEAYQIIDDLAAENMREESAKAKAEAQKFVDEAIALNEQAEWTATQADKARELLTKRVDEGNSAVELLANKVAEGNAAVEQLTRKLEKFEAAEEKRLREEAQGPAVTAEPAKPAEVVTAGDSEAEAPVVRDATREEQQSPEEFWRGRVKAPIQRQISKGAEESWWDKAKRTVMPNSRNPSVTKAKEKDGRFLVMLGSGTKRNYKSFPTKREAYVAHIRQSAGAAGNALLDITEGIGLPQNSFVHRLIAEKAVENGQPVSAAAVDAYGIKLPKGYVKQGDLYVQQKKAAPAGKEAATGVSSEEMIDVSKAAVGKEITLKVGEDTETIKKDDPKASEKVRRVAQTVNNLKALLDCLTK